MTDALITTAEIVAAFGVAGGACWLIDWWAKRKQADWQGENSMRGSR